MGHHLVLFLKPIRNTTVFRPPDQRDQRLERWRRHPGGDPPATRSPTMAMVIGDFNIIDSYTMLY